MAGAPSQSQDMTGDGFVEQHRASLIQNVREVLAIADRMLEKKMIHPETYSKIRSATTTQDQMRELYTALDSGGPIVKAEFSKILQDMNPYLVQNLTSDCCADEEIVELRIKYKESVRCEYITVQEYNSLTGESVQLDDRYTKLLIIQKHRKQKEREEELRSRGNSHQEVMNKRDSDMFMSTNVEKLFDPDQNGVVHKTVILQGQAGIGKSFTTQKIMSDWASGKIYSDFEYIFHIKCQQLNHISKNISVVDLILYNSQDLKPAVAQVLSCPEKILFIIDGFDELKFSLDVPQYSLCHDPHEQNTPQVTLSSLIRKDILSKAFLLITTRSTTLDKLTKVLKQPRYTEILGFSEEGMKEYFKNFFQNEQQALCAFNNVKKNEIVFTACFIPGVCWIVCTMLREKMDENTDIKQALNTTTTIFVYFVYTLLEHHCKSGSLPVQDILQRLGVLAESGIREQQVLFEEKQIKNTFSDPSQAPSSFLNKIILKKGISNKTVFSFMHLSFQEFFAAFSYIMCDEQESEKKVSELLRESEDKGHLLSTVQFLFGLSNQETQDFINEKYNRSISPAVQSQLEGWIKERLKKVTEHTQGADLMAMLHCLYEIHDEDFVRGALESLTNIFLSYYPLKRTDCAVLSYCLQAWGDIERLELQTCLLKPECLEVLIPGLHKCKDLK
ncbi:NACHT, LRR and PYD domains-containing protein 3-like [Acipenser oxyrinchus oxyrinchus]|uniref:NACHT, LRR and PYD domains-containing protein 3-like n=1 Tax=Acipenser oxyrinchus oxyrinchus TaxID=40147 RepID=A0AAD8CEB0_ACIOX|nr:NACHT, LRR and PYD domains-containing protein 3-like [Acipenser oxyrinchus oxyrinchus]